jgi:hypothetical protein
LRAEKEAEICTAYTDNFFTPSLGGTNIKGTVQRVEN